MICEVCGGHLKPTIKTSYCEMGENGPELKYGNVCLACKNEARTEEEEFLENKIYGD